jgi:hypothetical protein
MVAEVSWREYLRRREKEIHDCLARIRQCKSDLANHGQQVDDLEQVERNVTEYLNRLKAHFEEKAKRLEITILPVPSLDVRKLFQMSIECVPPFEDSQSDAGEKTKEKGFRDALIMFTVLENIRNHPEYYTLIVTDDKRLGEGFRRLTSEYSTQLEIASNIEAAISHCHSKLNKWNQDKLQQEADQAKTMLLKYRKDISDSVQQIRELTESDLGQGVMFWALAGLGGAEDEQRVDVDAVLSLDFDTIESALWKDKDKPISRILFKIRCIARVNARPSQPLTFWKSPAFTVGGGEQSEIVLSVSDEVIEKDLPVALYGEAQFENTDGEWRLMSLKVDKSLPPMEDWKDLLKTGPKTDGQTA